MRLAVDESLTNAQIQLPVPFRAVRRRLATAQALRCFDEEVIAQLGATTLMVECRQGIELCKSLHGGRADFVTQAGLRM